MHWPWQATSSNNTRDNSIHELHQMVSIKIRLLIFFCSWRWRSSIQSAKTKLGADCGSDHELLIEKLRLKLKKVGKTTRSFNYELNQIPYDYTVEVKNRFKRLNVIEYLKNYEKLFITLYRRLWSEPPPPKKKKKKKKEMQKSKMVVWGGLSNSWEKKRIKR